MLNYSGRARETRYQVVAVWIGLSFTSIGVWPSSHSQGCQGSAAASSSGLIPVLYCACHTVVRVARRLAEHRYTRAASSTGNGHDKATLNWESALDGWRAFYRCDRLLQNLNGMSENMAGLLNQDSQ